METVVGTVPPWLVVVLIVLSFLGSAILLTPLLAILVVLTPTERVLSWVAIHFRASVFRSIAKPTTDIIPPESMPEIPVLSMPVILPLTTSLRLTLGWEASPAVTSTLQSLSGESSPSTYERKLGGREPMSAAPS